MARLIRDPLGIRNERLKLFAGFFNAVGLGLIGFALLRPLTEAGAVAGRLPYLWTLAGLACHGVAHYVLGWIMKEGEDDDL